MTSGVSRNQLPVRAASSLSLVRISKGRWKRLVKLVLPLLGEAPRTDDQAALQVPADDQLLDEEPGHDGLAGAGVVGEQEAQRLAREHRFVDGGDLVRQRLDEGSVHGEHRIEQIGQPDALGFGHQSEQMPVAVEAPGSSGLDDLDGRLAVPVEELVGHPSFAVLEGDLDGVGPEPLHADERHDAVGEDAPYGRVRLEIFEPCHGRIGLMPAGVCRSRTEILRNDARSVIPT
jgi:hypothetical protein